MEEFRVENYRVRDDFRYERNADPVPVVVVTFYLGRHGPFTERFDKAAFSAEAFNQRVEQLRAQLRLIGG